MFCVGHVWRYGDFRALMLLNLCTFLLEIMVSVKTMFYVQSLNQKCPEKTSNSSACKLLLIFLCRNCLYLKLAEQWPILCSD